jgi:hypothetical protein
MEAKSFCIDQSPSPGQKTFKKVANDKRAVDQKELFGYFVDQFVQVLI